MNVSTVALAGTTASVTGTVVEGNIPVVGQLISISGAIPSYFNVTNASITSVSAAASPDVGVYTVQFALTNSNILTTNSPGVAVMPTPEVGEAVVLGASSALGLQSLENPSNGRTVRADVTFPTQAGSVVVTLQGAMVDLDGDYTDLASVASLTGGVLNGGVTVASVNIVGVTANFLRFNNKSLAGVGTTKIVAKVLI